MSSAAAVVFSDRRVFGKGFRPNADAVFCKLSKMLVQGHFADARGTIDIGRQAGAWRLDVLWSYVYYLYVYNRSNLDLFGAMSDPKTGRASARRFVSVVRSYLGTSDDLPIDVPTLILFVNGTIDAYGTRLTNPLFDYLQRAWGPSSRSVSSIPPRIGIDAAASVSNPEEADIRIRVLTNASGRNARLS